MLKLPNLCHCVQHPWKLTSKNFWSSRNESKPLSKQKCDLRKCCRVSQKWWMLKLPNLCHCLLVGISGSSRTERKALSKLKHVFRKCCGLSQKWWMLKLPNLCHCVKQPWKLSVGISRVLGMKQSHFLSKNVIWENAVGYLRNGEC